MVEKDFKHLQKHIRKASYSLQEVFRCLDTILSSNYKEFDIEFKGKCFNFHPGSDVSEINRMQKNRQQLIHKILKHCSRNLISNLKTSLSDTLMPDHIDEVWEMVLAFSMGEDQRSHQLEKIQDGIYAVKSDNLKKGTLGVPTIPLDQESDHIKHQDPKLFGREIGF